MPLRLSELSSWPPLPSAASPPPNPKVPAVDVARGQDCAMSRPCEVVSYCGRYLPKEGCSAGIIHRHGGHSGNRFTAQCPMQARGATEGRRACHSRKYMHHGGCSVFGWAATTKGT